MPTQRLDRGDRALELRDPPRLVLGEGRDLRSEGGGAGDDARIERGDRSQGLLRLRPPAPGERDPRPEELPFEGEGGGGARIAEGAGEGAGSIEGPLARRSTRSSEARACTGSAST
ncbi:MAG: hypothetical protein ACO4BJ_12300 [Planctomycetota bacterium]